MERTYEKYIVWTDSVKALNAQDELGALQLKYDDSLKTIQEKDDKLSGKQYMIVGLCTLVVILIAGLLRSIPVITLHCAQQKAEKHHPDNQRAQRTANQIYPKHIGANETDSR